MKSKKVKISHRVQSVIDAFSVDMSYSAFEDIYVLKDIVEKSR